MTLPRRVGPATDRPRHTVPPPSVTVLAVALTALLLALTHAGTALVRAVDDAHDVWDDLPDHLPQARRLTPLGVAA